ncbi:uncharacterized protein LOC110374545 [Helicoverpa armigera]|uniref:uncharacterized protein LOC110374545 n=1 Tax=Helicoverpa armigera TaxID=29058 RepID=UPI000B365FE8|nr:uncharacterized protein LOC110374545 [Helicoverpa armigera]PZC79701.1 hypothetical protein B5X24_HaOG216009 [Helicoverpa armigera]
MASDPDDFDKNIENLKSNVRASFARVYATLKARELKTLRQLDAIRKQCQDNKDLKRNCVQNIHICFEKESTLLENVSNFGVIDFEKLNFDSNTFTLEDYVSPEDDHMYSYKTIEEVTKEVEEGDNDLEAIEEAALKQITATDNCVCYVNIKSEEVSKKFRDLEISASPVKVCESSRSSFDNNEVDCPESITEDDKSDSSDPDVKKIDPTDDWLNSIKGQTETEPSQVTDVMEHSTIACL